MVGSVLPYSKDDDTDIVIVPGIGKHTCTLPGTSVRDLLSLLRHDKYSVYYIDDIKTLILFSKTILHFNHIFRTRFWIHKIQSLTKQDRKSFESSDFPNIFKF